MKIGFWIYLDIFPGTDKIRVFDRTGSNQNRISREIKWQIDEKCYEINIIGIFMEKFDQKAVGTA